MAAQTFFFHKWGLNVVNKNPFLFKVVGTETVFDRQWEKNKYFLKNEITALVIFCVHGEEKVPKLRVIVFVWQVWGRTQSSTACDQLCCGKQGHRGTGPAGNSLQQSSEEADSLPLPAGISSNFGTDQHARPTALPLLSRFHRSLQPLWRKKIFTWS